MKKALLIIDHGSKRQAANYMLEGVVELVRDIRPEIIVEGCHMELADPSIEDGVRACVESACANWPELKFKVAGHLGVHRNIAELVLERAGL